MKRLVFFILLFPFITGNSLHAQDTLPKFSVKNAGNDRIIIGWTNNFPTIKQLSIQRSFDSLAGFKTILTVPDPTTPQNGYVDANPVNDHMFYRLYIMLDKGHYLFSDARKPVADTLYRVGQLPQNDAGNTNNGDDKLQVAGFTPSLYVYTNRDGYVNIKLPDDEKPKKYSIKFFDEDGNLLFELKEIKQKNFKIDKANFYHAGWFRFELYEDGKLFEKYKIYLEKDF